MTTDQAIHFILWLIIASHWCIGVHAVAVKLVIEEIRGTTVDELWEKYSRSNKLIAKPFWACPACMASVHGTVIFFAQVSTVTGSGFWISFCVCLCGLNFVMSQFFVE